MFFAIIKHKIPFQSPLKHLQVGLSTCHVELAFSTLIDSNNLCATQCKDIFKPISYVFTTVVSEKSKP